MLLAIRASPHPIALAARGTVALLTGSSRILSDMPKAFKYSLTDSKDIPFTFSLPRFFRRRLRSGPPGGSFAPHRTAGDGKTQAPAR